MYYPEVPSKFFHDFTSVVTGQHLQQLTVLTANIRVVLKYDLIEQFDMGVIVENYVVLASDLAT